MIHIQQLIDDAKCYESVRAMRWADGVRCVHGGSSEVNKRGHDECQPHRQRYECRKLQGNSTISREPSLKAIISLCACGCCDCI
jgi:hypothetical protein